jgi:hypothetical protein
MGRLERRRLLLVAPALVGFALVVAACGGGSPEAGVASISTTTTATPTTEAVRPAAATGGTSSYGGALVEYALCMRAHGISSFPDPASLGPSGSIKTFKGEIAESVAALASSPRFQAAQRACAKYYGPPTTSSPQVSPEEMRKLLAVSHCMRAHGVPNFPDPNPTTGDMSPAADISRTSPLVLGALRACTPLARAAGLGPPNTGQ